MIGCLVENRFKYVTNIQLYKHTHYISVS